MKEGRDCQEAKKEPLSAPLDRGQQILYVARPLTLPLSLSLSLSRVYLSLVGIDVFRVGKRKRENTAFAMFCHAQAEAGEGCDRLTTSLWLLVSLS